MKKLDFNRGWTVEKAGSTLVKTVDLPHDAMLFEERSKEAKTAGASAYFEPGKYIYRKVFAMEEAWQGQKVVLECEGVYQNATVTLNGKLLAERPYGYTDFYVDLTEDLQQENELVIVADNAEAPNSRWYSGSGIYRPVWLHVGGPVCIAPQGICVKVQDASTVQVAVRLTGAAEEAVVKTQIFDGTTLVAEGVGNPVTLTVPEAKPWSEETPNLYRLLVTVEKDGAAADCDETSFGFRTLTWDGTGLKVNGKEVLLRGACIHHDNGILGACAFADAEERRVRIMKEAGFNAIRSAHNPMSKAMLDACDRLGMYVMDETFDMWLIHKNPFDYGKEKFTAWWQKDTQAMIEKDYNHPSVILYSIGNEISDLGLEEGQKLCKEMADFVRSVDPSRAVTLGINLMLATMVAKGKGLYGNGKEGEEEKKTGSQSMDSLPTSSFFNMLMNKMGGLMELAAKGKGADKIVEKVGDSLDMPGYNYAAPRYAKEAKTWPQRPFVGSETLPKALYKNWQLVKKIPQLTGDFMWTGWDYLGESGIGTVQYKDKKTKKDVEEGLIISGGPGVIDICGKMRPEVGWNRIIWGLEKLPVIGVDPLDHADDFAAVSMWRGTDAVESWSWPGCEGKKTNVVVYSGAAQVELLVGNKSYGKKKVHEAQAHFKNVVYVPGKITAIAYDAKGKRAGASTLVTAEGGTKLSVTPDKTVLRANGQDLCFLDLRLTDAQGTVVSSDDRKLTITVEGAGTLQGFGSARPHMAETFVDTAHTTYRGYALAAIRAGYEAGEIKVTICGEGLEAQTITLQVEA